MTVKPFNKPLLLLWLFSSPLLLLVYLRVGAVSLPSSEILAVLMLAISEGPQQAMKEYPTTSAILLHIRLPRAMATILAGTSLAVAGATMQGLFRNPLASPDILGVSAGASFGAVIAVSLGWASAHIFAISISALFGALCVSGLIYALAMRAAMGTQLLFVILAGLAVSSVLSGLISATLLLAEAYQINQFIFWTMGGLEGRLWQHVLWPAPFIVGLFIFLIKQGHALNLIGLGDENAHGTGIHVNAKRRSLMISAAALTALAISIAGPIGFIGLMVPHFVRLIFGPNHRVLLPLSAFAGAWFLLVADLLGRTLIAPHEIKVGIITTVIGGTYFIYLLIRTQRKGGL